MPRGSRRAPGPLTKAIAAIVKAELKSQGLTQAQGAAMTGVKKSVMSELLNGKTSFTIDELADLSKSLGLHIVVDVVAPALESL